MECPFNSAKSSSRPNGVLSIAGFRIFVHRPRACFPVRPGRCVISSDHRVYGAASAGSARTVRITIESSSAVQVRLGLGLGAEAETAAAASNAAFDDAASSISFNCLTDATISATAAFAASSELVSPSIISSTFAVLAIFTLSVL
jgi:hypothetical protein